ncbi:serine/Arginine-related protein 53 [Engraulis encrasicolus]|uniref:serine/Arginine-related protein 53 n=1 Tax=Engraulis encrasicolus TaxID=184585 RepID=UPI002FCE7826
MNITATDNCTPPPRLKKDAKTDEALRAKLKLEEEARKAKEEEGASLAEQVRRIKDIEAIESDSFVPQAFKSSRDTKAPEQVEVKKEALDSDWSTEQQVPGALANSIVYNDNDGGSLAHPSLFVDKEVAEELWLKRLVSMRQERLMGAPVP